MALLAVLAVSLGMRVNALWLPHWRGDQAQYVILASKLKHFGFEDYNLSGVDLGTLSMSPFEGRKIEFSVVKPRSDDSDGAYLQMMKSIGQDYYDEPLHMRAPLFPATLAFSHALFAENDRPFMVLSYGFGPSASAFGSWRVWIAQFWAAGLPVFFNLATVGLVACLAWFLFGSQAIALTAAVLLASNPVSIWLAHRLLTEDMTTFFVTASVTVFVVLWSRSRAGAAAAAGALAGLAVLVNQRTGLILPVTLGFAGIVFWQDTPVPPSARFIWSRTIAWIGRAVRIFAQPFFWSYIAAFIAVTGFWFWKVVSFYGTPLHQPTQQMVAAIRGDSTGWFAAVASRPHPSILLSAGVIVLCPLLVFALMTWKRSWNGWTGRARDPLTRGLMLLWAWVAVFFFYLADLTHIFATGGREHRYFYPAYPALAVLAAFGLNALRAQLEKQYPGYTRLIRGIVVVLLFLNLVWGGLQAYPKVFGDELLF